MPFDFVRTSQHDALDAALARIGLAPVASETLESHKAEQIRLHPCSWMYRHSVAVQLGRSFVLIGALVGFVLLTAAGFPACGLWLAVALAVAVALSIALPVRGAAAWRERPDRDLVLVHPVIRDQALRLRQELPEIRFVIGELYQDRVRLDPYLLAELGGRRVVLGIWDEDRLIADARAL